MLHVLTDLDTELACHHLYVGLETPSMPEWEPQVAQVRFVQHP